MSYYKMLDTVYIFTLHLWYSLEYLLNLFVSEILIACRIMMFTKMTYFSVILIFIYLTL